MSAIVAALAQEALANAETRRATKFSNYGHASVATPKGVVRCYVDTAVANPGRSRIPGKHVRFTFKLDGRVISRANLEEILA